MKVCKPARLSLALFLAVCTWWIAGCVTTTGKGGGTQSKSTAGSLSISPTSVDFGTVTVGTTATQSATLVASDGEVIVQSVSSGNGFSISGVTFPVSVAPGSPVPFNIDFSPPFNGSQSTTLVFTGNNTNSPMSVQVTGNGAIGPTLSVWPPTMDFGTIVVGNNSTQTGTLTASGNTVNVTAASTTDSHFVVSGINFPLSLPAGQKATYTVTYTPTSATSTSATLTFTSDAVNAPTTENLTGTGANPTSHSVDLTWIPPTTPVVSYNVYRGLSSGGPFSKINSSPVTITAFTDSNVQSGQTYFYVVTSVDATGAESTFSVPAKAVIPIP